VAFNAPLRTRSERAEALRKKKTDFWGHYSPAAQEVLNAILDKYAEIGPEGLDVPEVLKVQPLSDMGSIMDLVARFGGTDEMKAAITELQAELYAA
jgi:type I restriction enzyme R subunit